MKTKMKKTLLTLLAATAAVGLASCGGDEGKESSYQEFNVDQVKEYATQDVNKYLQSVGSLEQFDATVKGKLTAAHQKTLADISSATDKAGVSKAVADGKKAMANAIPYANGGYSYAGATNAEKTKILGKLESYAVDSGLTGISLFENGGYAMYNDRVQLGTQNYIPGYGFGLLSEGKLTKPMEKEPNEAYKMYIHDVNPSDPGTINQLNDMGSEVSGLYSYISGSFFTQFMNETKDGYDWVPEMAKQKPVAMNAAPGSSIATKWRFELRVGEELKYSTLSADRSAFNNRQVKAEDYEYAMQLLLTAKNQLKRGAELAAKTTGAIKGAAAYFKASENGVDEKAWKDVGYHVVEEGGKTYLEYEFTSPVTQFYSMYYINSNMYQPIPKDFIDAIGGVQNYGNFSDSKKHTPVDNILSLGAYTLENWESDKAIVYKKNPNYPFASTKFQIAGVHTAILKGMADDQNIAFNEFLAGKTDSTSIPRDHLQKYKNDPRAKKTTGDSVFKLNVNATDEATWEKLFGEHGTVTQNKKEDYWDVKPVLSNPYFTKALSLSINRDEFASARGSIPTVNYLSSNYMSDPENGISYSNTKEHKDAVKNLLEGTQNGYNLEKARNYFKLAMEQLEAEGKYTPGTPENPTVIKLEVAWMYAKDEKELHNEIKNYIETAFNHESVTGGKYKLELNFWVGAEWSDVYYKKMLVGQYDIGFGSISGNPLNPLDFTKILSSNKKISGNFTLNWGPDTSDADSRLLVYEGVRWSYDALWQAGNTSVVVKDGRRIDTFSADLVRNAEGKPVVTKNADGSYKLELTVEALKGEGFESKLVGLVLYTQDAGDEDGHTYKEVELEIGTPVEKDGKKVYTITVSKELAEAYKINAKGDRLGIDVIYSSTIKGIKSVSIYDSLEGFNFE